MLRPLRLARIAAEAEGLRLRYVAQRTATRGIVGVIALIFVLAALGFFHIALWFWLRRHFESPAIAYRRWRRSADRPDLRSVRRAIFARSTGNRGARDQATRAGERHQRTHLFHAGRPGAPRRDQYVPTRALIALAHPLPDTGFFIQPVLLEAAEVSAGHNSDHQALMHHRHVAEPTIAHQP